MLPTGSAVHDQASLQAGLAHALKPLGLGEDAIHIDGNYPNLNELRLTLTGAQFRRDLRGSKAVDAGQPAFFARTVRIEAAPARFETLPFTLQATAQDVVVHSAQDASRAPVLVPVSAGGGDVELFIAQEDLQKTIAALGREAAEKQGAELKSVDVRLTGIGPQTVQLSTSAAVKAMFVTANLKLDATATLTPELGLRLSNLTCTGDGMIANMAAGMVRPKLALLEGRTFDLRAYVPQLQSASLDATGGLRIRAKLGKI